MSEAQLFVGPMPTPEDEIIGTDANGMYLYAGPDGIKRMVLLHGIRNVRLNP